MQKTKAKQTKTNNKGITLVALVITVIVLLILAAVGIGAIAGPEGLIAKAKQAAEGYNDAAQDEAQTINELLNMIGGEKTPPQEGITSTEIANNPEEYYGAYVDYTPQNGAPVGWRIFYADSENIYLIADDYILAEYAPEPTNGTTIDKTGNYSEYCIDFETLAESSTAYPVEDERVEKWISGLNTFTASNPNMKATAYLLDTEAWSVFKDTLNKEESKVEYVIGGPTLELFIASYNNTHETDINYEVTNEIGYSIKWSTDSSYSYYIEGLNTTEALYINDATDNRAYGYWLASPSADYDYRYYESYSLFGVGYSGNVNHRGYSNYDRASRPLVCLKSEIQLVEQENGKYAIQWMEENGK